MRFVSPTAFVQMERDLGNIDKTYDSNHWNRQVRLDHWANFEVVTHDIADEMDHQLK